MSPNIPLFGRTGEARTIDGWRDDIHPRKISYVVESLALFREILTQGKALAYAPDFWAEKNGVEILKVTGCSFRFQQKLYCSAKRAGSAGWLGSLCDDIAESWRE